MELAQLKKAVDELGASTNKLVRTADMARERIKQLEQENAELRQMLEAVKRCVTQDYSMVVHAGREGV